MTAALSSLERARRSRERERLGVRLVRVPLGPEHCEVLMSLGLIHKANMRDRERLALAVELLIGAIGAGAVNINFDAFIAHIRSRIAPA